MVNKVRFGFLGVAHFHADSYGRAIKQLPTSEIVAVYDDDERLGKEYAQKFNIEYYRLSLIHI